MAAAVLFLGSLLYYDGQLAREYHKGDYLSKYYGYEPLDNTGFDEVDLQSATGVTVTIERGPYMVRIIPRAERFVVLQQMGRRLIISSKFQDQYSNVNETPMVYISCPNLRAFRSDAHFLLSTGMVIDSTVGMRGWKPTEIAGFTQDSLELILDHGSDLRLWDNKIGKLTALMGTTKNGFNGPSLNIEDNNDIHIADLLAQGQSQLSIAGKSIQQLTYHLADSANLTINGVAARHLNLH